MNDELNFKYFKRSVFRGGQALSIVRHLPGSNYEYWTGTNWKRLCDRLDWIRFEDDYWEIHEHEALEALPRLTVRYEEIRRERQAEIERAERRKIEDERMNRTLHSLDGSWSGLERAAVALHDLYKSLTAAGFSDEQAIKIVSQVLATTSKGDEPPQILLPSLN